MQILPKREKDMSKEEKIKLDLVRVIGIAQGRDIQNPNNIFRLVGLTPSVIVAELILRKFKLSYNNEDDAKEFLNEKDASWPGKDDYGKLTTTPFSQDDEHRNAILMDKANKARMIDDLNVVKFFKEKKKDLERVEKKKAEVEVGDNKEKEIKNEITPTRKRKTSKKQ